MHKFTSSNFSIHCTVIFLFIYLKKMAKTRYQKLDEYFAITSKSSRPFELISSMITMSSRCRRLVG